MHDYRTHHHEPHRSQHSGWLRAAVLGANDGLISTSSLMLGMVTAQTSATAVILGGLAGLVAGALSMAAGEYVSVSSQADAELADIRIESRALQEHPELELQELTGIYIQRGLEPALARQVAEQLTAHDDLATHLRDDVGLSELHRARPIQAALASAAAFTVGALPPVLTGGLWQGPGLAFVLTGTTMLLLAILGYTAERVAGGRGGRGAVRVLFWGGLAQAVTAVAGYGFGMAMG